ncbi:MAG TPA: hypothetical protein VGX78_05735 [Pirellulales bacterium]|jgi:hypothetical protein|nr:hypothetical protein [Pirellulales bacterium]
MTNDNHHTLDQLQRAWQQYVTRPLDFVTRFWPRIKLAPYQAEILESVVNNHETWVHSANQMGKSFIAAMTVVWWFCTRCAKVVTSSATEEQLNHVLWGEIDHLLRTAQDGGDAYDFQLQRSQLRLWLPSQGLQKTPLRKYYTLGQVAAQVESFQGHHLPPLDDGTPTVLFVFEEASALETEFYEAATSQAHRMLAIGNPLRSTGIFYEKCRAGDQRHPDGTGRAYRKVIHVSGEHSPNVLFARSHIASGRPGPPPVVVPGILTHADFLARQANWPPDKVRTRLLGQFPDEADERLFPSEWLDLAQQLGAALQKRGAGSAECGAERDEAEGQLRAPRSASGHPRSGSALPDRPYALGVDVASGGADETAWVVLGRYGVREIVAKRTPNTAEIAGHDAPADVPLADRAGRGGFRRGRWRPADRRRAGRPLGLGSLDRRFRRQAHLDARNFGGTLLRAEMRSNETRLLLPCSRWQNPRPSLAPLHRDRN